MVFYTAGCEELKRAREIKDKAKRRKEANDETINHIARGHVENIFALDTYNFLADEMEDCKKKTIY